jgi:hypothetical protein
MRAMAGAATASAQPVKKRGSSSKDKNDVFGLWLELLLVLPKSLAVTRKKNHGLFFFFSIMLAGKDWKDFQSCL